MYLKDNIPIHFLEFNIHSRLKYCVSNYRTGPGISKNIDDFMLFFIVTPFSLSSLRPCIRKWKAVSSL